MTDKNLNTIEIQGSLSSIAFKLLSQFILLLLSVSPILSQFSFYNTYTGNDFDIGQGITEVTGGKFAVTGSSSSLAGDGAQAFIMLIDQEGNHEWTKPYGGSNSDWGRRVFFEEGQGFWLAGYSNSFGDAMDFDFMLMHMDMQGELISTQTYGSSDWERIWDATRVSDGGFFLVGERSGDNSIQEDMFLVKTDEFGDTLWTKVWQTDGVDIAYATAQLNDTTLLVAGTALDTNENQGAVLLAYSLDGELYWEKYYGENVESSEFRAISVYDDKIFLGGGLVNPTTGILGNWVMRLNDVGDIEVNESFAREGVDYASTVLATIYYKFYWTMYSEAEQDNVYPGGGDLFFYLYNQDILFTLSRSFSGFDPDIAHQMIATSDGGVAIVGEVSDKSQQFSAGRHVLVIKIGPNDEMVLDRLEGNDLVNTDEFQKSANLSLFPNPVVNQLHIVRLQNQQPTTYSIHDLKGTIISKGTTEGEVNVEHLEGGIYFLKLANQHEYNQVLKFIKK